MIQFDAHRFMLALRCQFLSTRRQWIRLFCVYTLSLLMIELGFTRLQCLDYQALVDQCGEDGALSLYVQKVQDTAIFAIVFFQFAMLFGACYIFRHLKETHQRTTYLMWPVSNLEKFLVLLVHSILLMAVFAIGAYVLADALRILLDALTGRELIWGVPQLFEPIRRFSGPWQGYVYFAGLMLYFHSLYILGGALFRRHQFLSTSVAILFGIFLITWIGRYLLYLLSVGPDAMMVISVADGKQSFQLWFYLWTAGFYLLMALNYWLAYRVFCRMQVINNKWLNL